MESISLLPSKHLFLHSRSLLGHGHGNLSFCQNKLHLKNLYSLSSRPSGSNNIISRSSAFESPKRTFDWRTCTECTAASKQCGTNSVGVAKTSHIELTSDSVAENSVIPVSDEDERIENLVMQIKEMFRSMNDGETGPSAYDTAWVARIPSKEDPAKPHFPTTLNWIQENQHNDGSWGELSIFHLYDRLVCTLACILALKTWSRGAGHIAKGLKFLGAHAEQLGEEANNSRTCAFEIVFPSMLNEAKSIGLELPYDTTYWKKIVALREKKISRIPSESMHSVHTTMLYSLEALQEVVQWKQILKLQSPDGSSLSSPAATAVAYMKTGDSKSLEYLTNIIQRFGDYAPSQYPIDLVERIWAVDTIERLGIDHHFRKEISDTLNYVHRNIGKRGVPYGSGNPIPDIDDTCMALRLTRLHGYAISPDVLEYFKDDDGDFICHPGETHRGVSDMFNLYRLSKISFPGEKILEDAKPILEQYLQNCIENQVDDKWSLKKALNKEIEHALRFPWKMSLQRLEAREYINHYGENDLWIGKTVYWMYNVNNPKYLELAKLDYNRLQVIYKKEMDYFSEEIYFSIAATIYEPEFKECRIAYTKSNCIEDILRDLFHNHSSTRDLKLFSQAVEQWNPSLVHSLPSKVKVTFMGMYDVLNEVAIQASNAQGKDVFPYLHDLRMKQIQNYLTNIEKAERKYSASLTEYIENGKKDCAIAIRTVPAMCLMGAHLQGHVLRGLDNRSRIHDRLSLYLRLLLDVRTYENMTEKETTTAIWSYMTEENCTEEEALNHLKRMTEDVFHELVHEYLKPSQVPRCCRRLMFEHGRIANFFLGDNISSPLTQREIINEAMVSLFSPV